MANLPPPNNDPNELNPDQAPATPVGFAPQWIGWQNPNNNNGWLDEDDDEEPEEDEADEDNDEEMEEEEYEEIEDEEEEEFVAEEEAKIIYLYDEADPNNQPPPALDDESEFAHSVIPVIDAENRPVPHVIHFSSTYELSESSSARENNRPPPSSDDESEFASSSAREILKDIGKVSLLGPVPPTIGTAMSRIRKLNEQMRERAEVDKRIVKKIDKNELRIRMVGRDAMNLDGAVRECQVDISKVISMMESMSLEFERVRKESRRALELVEWEAGVREQYLLKLQIGGGFIETSTRSFLGPFLDDPYVQARNAAMADDDVEDDDVEDDDDMDDDVADPSDPQSSEPRGSLRDSQIMPPKQMSQAAIAKLVTDEVAKALAADRATRNTSSAGGPGNVGDAGNAGGLERAQPAKDCTFSSFMKCGPTQFHGKEGAIELCRWFEKIECTFGISECAERNKVKFAAATLQEEFCPEEEISRMKDELRHLRLKDNDIAAYTNQFNELVLLCPDVVPTTKKKIGQYIKGLPSYINSETYSSKPTTLNEAVRMAGTDIKEIDKIKDKMDKTGYEKEKRVKSRDWDEKQIKSWSLPELLLQLLNDSQTINENLKQHEEKRIESEQAANQAAQEESTKAITPDLPTEEPGNSLSMGDDHLNTIPEMKSDEVIKSSVKNLVLIPSESKGISDDICDVPICDHDHFDTECGLIDSLLSRDISIASPMIDVLPEEFAGELDLIDPILPGIDEDDFDEEEGEIDIDILQIKDEILREKLLNVNLLIDKIKALNLTPSIPFVLEYPSSSPILVVDSDFLIEEVDSFLVSEDSIPPGIESDFNSEEDIVFLDNLLNNDPIPEYERFTFDIEPDAPVINNFDELNEDECFDPGGGEIFLPDVEDDDSFTFVIRTFLPFLTYPEDSPLLLSTGSEDTIFDPGIST
ncbi:putative reverse transcriptase domain-containing protein [Tanacetum coccineum]